MNGRAAVAVAVVALLLVGSGPVVATDGTTASARTQSDLETVQQDEIDADEVRMDVAIESDGTAEWTVEFWVELDDEESETSFDSLRDDVRDDPDNYTESFAERMNETVSTSSEATGREMSTDGYDVSTERQSFAREYGVVRYTFDWHGFAAVEGEELRAGDAIEGIYLDDGTRLLIEWPEEYERRSVTPEPDDERDRAVIWRGGETEFVSGEPRVTLTAAGAGPGTATIVGVAVAIGAGFGAVGLWWYRTRASDGGEGIDGVAGPSGESDAVRTPPPDSVAGRATTDESESAGTNATGTVDTELLSNEEQVLRLLRDDGGRMKQQTVVEELGWTDAKTSKVVSGLRDEGRLESFRLGRENVLSLPEAGDPDPTAPGGDESE
ncbi:hypothetical protein ACFQGT_02715 [Natrialbaceae archaeon GCM10025810]|uniref:DUF7343 domain-containing protein n=1 Tax=Halovalidus salilacus TaxID=3075124 RepID=UPI00361A9122